RDAVLDWHREQVAAGREQDALAVGRDLSLRHVLAYVHERAARTHAVFEYPHRYFLGLLRLHVEAVNVAAVLEDDGSLGRGRELAIELGELRVSGHGLRFGIDG